MKFPKVSLIMNTDRQTDRDFLLGITRYASSNGPWEFVYKPLQYLDTKSKKQTNLSQHSNSDGFIVRGRENLQKITKFAKPIVYSGIRKESTLGITTIITDSSTIGKMAAKYLISLGLKNYSYCGFKNIEWSTMRLKSYISQLNRENISPEIFNIESDRKKLMQWLTSIPKPNAMFACNDDCAMQIIDAAKILNIKIPEDIIILGVDNDELVCSLTHPQISSIDLNFEKSGYEAAKALDNMMKLGIQKEMQITVKPLEIIERQSTDITRMQEETVSSSLEYIRLNFQHPIQVQDVVNNSGISRRTLEKKFKKNLNRSIYSEMKRLRIDYIAKALLETNLTISEIAAKLNFSSPEHIARQFKSLKGLSPSDYRKQNSNNQIL